VDRLIFTPIVLVCQDGRTGCSASGSERVDVEEASGTVTTSRAAAGRAPEAARRRAPPSTRPRPVACSWIVLPPSTTIARP
jgi:hypothetical protein